jgi:hypothetical protein
VNLKTFEMKRFPPWLRAALTLYLLGTLFLVAVHQHHDASQAHDCGLCALAHTPAVTAPATLQPAHADAVEYLRAASNDRGWDSEFSRAARSRAPPLA